MNNIKPNISIIINTKNESKKIEKLLKSIKYQTYKNYEIILVDNFSSDNTITLAKKYTNKIFIKGNERSVQKNYGAKKAYGKYLLFLDADMELPKEILIKCLKKITVNKSSALIIPETIKGKGLFYRIMKLEKQLYLNEPLIEAPRFISKKLFLKIKGYDKHLIAGEDWDLNEKMLPYTKISRIKLPLYVHDASFINEISHKIYYLKNIQYYIKKHPDLFKKQSSLTRVIIFLKKPRILFQDIPATIGLLLLKSFEYLLFLIFRLKNFISTPSF